MTSYVNNIMREEAKKEGEEEETEEVPKSEEFVERITAGVVVSTNHPQGIFIIDSLRPDLSLRASKKDGSIQDISGRNICDVRLFITPQIAKRLCKSLKKQLGEYEEKMGEVKIE